MFRPALLAACLLVSATAAHALPAKIHGPEILVVAEPRTAATIGPDHALHGIPPEVTAVLARHGLDHATEVARGPRRDGAARVIELRSARPGFDAVAAARELAATGAFRAVIPNYVLHLFATVPNDPDLPLQYSVDDGGNADVRLPAAWDLGQGDTATVIGVMDTGVDLGHPDLAAQIWTNRGEVPGNGIDDDGDGYIDDAHGWDFGDDDADPDPHAVIDEASGLDVGFHGTFVAAIASAATDNAEGIAGAGWRCRIMPLKVVDSSGQITAAAIAGAFAYASAHHVSVLNMSLGGPGDPGVPEFFQALVDDANASDVLCVAAAGNDGTDTPSYPAASAGVLAVAATNDANVRADFSNWGPWVDVAAPGASMWSAICTNYDIDELSQIFYLFFFGWDGERPYMYGDGTSFACPLASGVCGLVRAKWPYLLPHHVIEHMIATGDVGSYDHPIGPKLNAFRALSEIPVAVEAPPVAALSLAAPWPNPFMHATALRFALPRDGVVNLRVYDAAGRMVRDLAHGAFGAGVHTVTWNGADARGTTAPAGIYFATLATAEGVRRVKIVRVE